MYTRLGVLCGVIVNVQPNDVVVIKCDGDPFAYTQQFINDVVNRNLFANYSNTPELQNALLALTTEGYVLFSVCDVIKTNTSDAVFT